MDPAIPSVVLGEYRENLSENTQTSVTLLGSYCSCRVTLLYREKFSMV
jgi:hypothetical protein